MKKGLVFPDMRKLVVGLVLLLVSAASLPLLASSALRLSFDDLVRESDRVVEATVTGRQSAWASDNRRIYTTFTFETHSDIAGTGPARFVVIQPGGQVGRLAQITHGYPAFNRGDRVVLFLRKVVKGYDVIGLSQGVFGFHRDVIHQKLEGLDFPGDHGRPIVLDRREAFDRIRRVFAERRAP
jgi:hypothetical protein